MHHISPLFPALCLIEWFLLTDAEFDSLRCREALESPDVVLNVLQKSVWT